MRVAEKQHGGSFRTDLANGPPQHWPARDRWRCQHDDSTMTRRPSLVLYRHSPVTNTRAGGP
jgi:hypothetical protein